MMKVGILGGGQLGLMLVNSIAMLGGEAVVYDPDPDAPAARHVRTSVAGSFMDFEKIEEFVHLCDVVTYEFENVETAPLKRLAEIRPIYPGVHVLETTQNRIVEKQFLKNNGLPHAGFETIAGGSALLAKMEELPFPGILKSARGGYDGKGQHLLKSRADVERLPDIDDDYLGVFESLIDIELEVSCIVASPISGPARAFPVFENRHENHILEQTIVPARVPEAVSARVQEIALEATQKLDVTGLLTTEFFLARSPDKTGFGIECDGWYIFVNEFAPRPHNSGHVTINACRISQFDALARILMAVPLTSTDCNSPLTYCMTNLLGDTWIDQDVTPAEGLSLDCMENCPELVDIVIYGKREARRNRKMGHFVTASADPGGAAESASLFKKELSAANQ